MRANPGGEIEPANILGRSALVKRIWRVLDRQSAVLAAERRIGKTCILKKMRAECPDGWIPLFRDLEGLRSPLEFVETVFRDVKQYLSKGKRALNSFQKLRSELGGVEIGGMVKLPEKAGIHWKRLLEETLADLNEQTEFRFVFFWDEMPLMLENIKKDHGEKAAMEILDTLRAQRQMYSRLRMVYTGSIGLHHIVSHLKRAGYANAPINDMFTLDVPPLDEEDGTRLANELLTGENIECEYMRNLALEISSGVGQIPYYIHHMVDQIAIEGKAPESLSQLVEKSLLDSQDPWDMAHYRERITTYYKDITGGVKLALAVLDVTATANTRLSFDELNGHAGIVPVSDDPESLRDLLALLKRDHYLEQDKEGYRFRHKLVQRWWALQRGL